MKKIKENGRVYFEGVVLEFDKPTKNNRIYTKDCIECAINNYKTRIEKNFALGCIYNKGEFNQNDFLYTSGLLPISDASHVVDKLWIDDKTLKCRILVLNTPKGIFLSEQSPINLNLYSVGIGNLYAMDKKKPDSNNDASYVVEKYEFCSICVERTAPVTLWQKIKTYFTK